MFTTVAVETVYKTPDPISEHNISRPVTLSIPEFMVDQINGGTDEIITKYKRALPGLFDVKEPEEPHIRSDLTSNGMFDEEPVELEK